MIPVVVISLVRSTDRRASMKAQLEAIGIAFRFFDAIDGDSITGEQATAICRHPNPRYYGRCLLSSELGNIMSFRQVCEAIARGEDDFVCVLEDDVILNRDVQILLEDATLRLLPRFDVLRIQHTSRRSLPVAAHGPLLFRAPFRPTTGLYAQIFTRDGAAKVAAGLAEPWMQSDVTVFSDGIVPNLRILEVHPPVASHPPLQRDKSIIDADGDWPGDSIIASRATLLWRARRMLYESASLIRVLRNFVRLWGWTALTSLKR
jgi:GR25 family glycosyltransferase involved in LPS biosynthesis